MSIIKDKINATLLQLGYVPVTSLAKTKPTKDVSGTTSGATTGLTENVNGGLPSVIVTEFVPKNIKISYSAIGAPVLQTEEDGKEEPAEDGDYELITNKTITVKDGKLVAEIDTPEEDIEEHSGETKTTMAIVEKVEVPIAMATNPADSLKAALQRAGIKLDKKGSYCLNIEVGEDGTISYGTLQTNTYENLLMAKEEEFSGEIDKLTSAIETRLAAEKDKYEKLVEAHMHGIVPSKEKGGAQAETKMSKTDILKQQIASKVQTQE